MKELYAEVGLAAHLREAQLQTGTTSRLAVSGSTATTLGATPIQIFGTWERAK